MWYFLNITIKYIAVNKPKKLAAPNKKTAPIIGAKMPLPKENDTKNPAKAGPNDFDTLPPNMETPFIVARVCEETVLLLAMLMLEKVIVLDIFLQPIMTQRNIYVCPDNP